jgi:hypothetical protein
MPPHDPQPLTPPLAAHPDGAVFEIEVAIVEGHELADTQSRGIHQFEDRPVAESSRRVRFGCTEKPADFPAVYIGFRCAADG